MPRIIELKEAWNKKTRETRSKFSAVVIDGFLNKKQCNKIVHLAGLNHLSSVVSPQNSLPNLLQAKKINSKTIGLQPTTDLYTYGIFNPTALRCEPGTPQIKATEEGIGIRAQDIEFQLIPFEKNSDPIDSWDSNRWKDFDAIFFYPPLN